MCTSETIVSTLCTRGASPTVTAAASLSVPTVLSPSHTATRTPVLCICAARCPVKGQRGGWHTIIHIKGDITVRSSCTVTMHTESSSSTPASFSQTSLGRWVAAAAPHTLPKVFTNPSTLLAALLGVIATCTAGKGIIYGVS